MSPVVFAVVTLCSLFYGRGGIVGLKTANAETAQTADTAVSVDEITEIANGIIGWKKQDVGSEIGGYLINDDFLSLAGRRLVSYRARQAWRNR